MIPRMDTSFPAVENGALAAPPQLSRDQIADRFKWNLSHIFADWDAWQRGYEELDRSIAQYAALQGTLKGGPAKLLAALTLGDAIGQLEYKVWYFPSLKYDEDQRDNAINARRQQVQILAAKGSQAMAWFNPELLAIPLETVRQWMDASAGARPRRQGRASPVAVEPAVLDAQRHLRRAVDG